MIKVCTVKLQQCLTMFEKIYPCLRGLIKKSHLVANEAIANGTASLVSNLKLSTFYENSWIVVYCLLT